MPWTPIGPRSESRTDSPAERGSSTRSAIGGWGHEGRGYCRGGPWCGRQAPLRAGGRVRRSSQGGHQGGQHAIGDHPVGLGRRQAIVPHEKQPHEGNERPRLHSGACDRHRAREAAPDSDAYNGFANRFLWVCVRRSKTLPFGGEWERQDVAGAVALLGEVLRFAKRAGEMRWGDSARPLWVECYPSLSEGAPGLLGAVTSRAEAQVLRLACVYALMESSVAIELEHLKAALAVWDYAEASARYVFGDATGDAVADRIEEMLTGAQEGLTRAQIRDAFGRNKSSERIGAALELLERHGRVFMELEQTGGRPAERWFIE